MRYKIVRITALLTVVFMAAAAFAQTRTKEQTTVMKMKKDTITLSAEERTQNMQEVHDYVRECGYYTIATVDGDQPRVRAFNSFEIINGRLYVMTGKRKMSISSWTRTASSN